MDLPTRVATWRKFRKLTMAQLAERAELSVSSISQIENGKQGVSTETLEKIVAALELSMSRFHGRLPKLPKAA